MLDRIPTRRHLHDLVAPRRRFAAALPSLWIACLLFACNDDADQPIAQRDGGDEPTDEQAKPAPSVDEDAPTWNHDIAPIVVPRCTGCHQDGSIAPFSMTTYEDAKPFASAMAAAVMSGRMPPFLAQESDDCQPRFPWRYDNRLDEDEKELLQRWADAGAPEGKAAKGPAPESPPIPKLEREDLVLALPEPIEVDGTKDIHTCVVIDPELEQDEFVTGRLVTPGNPTVVHHVISWIIAPDMNAEGGAKTKAEMIASIKEQKGIDVGGRYPCFGSTELEDMRSDLLDGWAPGSLPNVAPADSGQFMSKESLIVLDMHYHPVGAVEVDDSTSLALTFADEKPSLISGFVLLGNFAERTDTDYGIGDLMLQDDEDTPGFMIPAGAKRHIEDMTWTWKLPSTTVMRIYGVGTHMHYVGRNMRVNLVRGEATEGQPDEECLIETPAWDFNWQRGYAYDAELDELPTMRNGDTLQFHCEYDNTLDNPFIRKALDDQGLDAPVDVPLGEDTLDEMCVGAIGYITDNPL